MKSAFKIMNLKKLFLLPLAIFMLMVSCQTEEVDIVNPPQEEIIEANSTTANLMSRTASNDGSIDNIIDYANCLEVVLPVTVTANGVTITIESFTDYDALEALLDAFIGDSDEVEITFPITVILNDYTELVLNSQAELNAQIENCNGENEEDEDIECVDFQYPISFSIYNTDFQVTETVTIENDEALYNFIETLNSPVIASLNFPVTLVLANGQTVEVNNNQELDIAISEAEDDCDEDDDYDWNDDDLTAAVFSDSIMDCLWKVYLVEMNGDPISGYNDHVFDFQDNGVLVVTSPNGNYVGEWLAQDLADGGIFVSIVVSGLSSDINDYYELVFVDGNYVRFENNNIGHVLKLEKNCDLTSGPSFDCFGDNAFTFCEDAPIDGITTINLDELLNPSCNSNDFIITFHDGLTPAQLGTNALTSPYETPLPNNFQTIYQRVEWVNDSSVFVVNTIQLNINDCTNNGMCTESEVDAILQECEWTITSYVGDTSFNIFNMNFMAANGLTIESASEAYTGNWSTSQDPSLGVVVEFYDIAGGNVQVLNGSFKVVECTTEQMIFHDVNDSNNELVLDRVCI